MDSLVFAWLSYLRLPGDMAELTNWQGLDVRELLRAECYRDMIDDLWDPEGSRALLEAVAASPRYRGVHVCGYRSVRCSPCLRLRVLSGLRISLGICARACP